MTHKPRKAIVFAVAAAIVIAGCLAPRLAHAHNNLHATVKGTDRPHQHSHAHDGPRHVQCQEKSGTKNQSGDTASQNPCCAAACAATVFILNSHQLPEVAHRHGEVPLLVEQLRAFVPSAVDPPPRTI